MTYPSCMTWPHDSTDLLLPPSHTISLLLPEQTAGSCPRASAPASLVPRRNSSLRILLGSLLTSSGSQLKRSLLGKASLTTLWNSNIPWHTAWPSTPLSFSSTVDSPAWRAAVYSAFCYAICWKPFSSPHWNAEIFLHFDYCYISNPYNSTQIS